MIKYVLSFLLFSVTFQDTLTRKETLDKMARVAITLKKIVKYKQDTLRKLQNTDDFEPYTTPTNLPKEAEETIASNEVMTDEVIMPSDIPVTTQNSTASPATKSETVQVKKFHKFERKTKGLKFGLFFFFLNKPIVESVIMRIVIKYKTSRLRNLASGDITGETAPTTCLIKDEYRNKLNQMGNGDNVDYDCTATTTSSAPIEEAKIDPKKPMVIGNEVVPLTEVEFNEDSKDGTENLVTISDPVIAVLENTIYKIEDKKLILIGEIKPKNALELNKPFKMEFYDTSNEELKEISCQAKDLETNGQCTIECDTSNTPLITNYGNLTLSKHDSKDLYLSLNIPENAERSQIINTGIAGGNTYYRKASSGLSGGAIAGIVIACVVALAAASIAAIMLRKPSPPIDNTTVVGLKTVENM